MNHQHMANNFVFGAINDQDKALQSNGGNFKFGLNENCHVVSIMYNPNGTNNPSTPCVACDITMNIGGTEMRRRVFDIQRIFGKNGQELTPNDPDYASQYAQNMTQNMAVITHIVKAVGVTDEQIKTAFATPAQNFAEWIQRIISLLPANYTQIPIDVFLEYQWNISPNQTQTFLEIPKNMKGGYFAVPHMQPNGAWKEERTWIKNNKTIEGLRYVDNTGIEHPFVRTQNYMESNKAIRQSENDTVNVGQSALNNLVNQNNSSAMNNNLPW